ncbi:unnamed protein product [Paramecium sonneborni]|uniref:Uncharacterized protein n=1 Tax=Paramecium sonneborni TaxID=65129 RepID=A0A8S1RN78_9CILI|nr:unnamed protein product [Paramecium sonneborni]
MNSCQADISLFNPKHKSDQDTQQSQNRDSQLIFLQLKMIVNLICQTNLDKKFKKAGTNKYRPKYSCR